MATHNGINRQTLLDAVVHLPKGEFDQFVRQAKRLRKSDSNLVVSAKEADILHRINTTFAPEDRARYNELYARFKDGVISEPEREELTFLIEKFEDLDANRLKLIGQLAKLRKESVDDVIETFELTIPENV
jgi:hypothetical protein